VVVNGVPKPVLPGLAANKTPHLVTLGHLDPGNLHLDLLGAKRAEKGGVDLAQPPLLPFERADHSGGADPKHPRRVSDTAGVHRHIGDFVGYSWLPSEGRVVQDKGVFGAVRVPAPEPLLALGQGAVPDNIFRPTDWAGYFDGSQMLSSKCPRF